MLNLIKLESRIVLDGAGAGEAADHAADQDAVEASGSDNAPDHPGDDYSAQVADAAALLADGGADASSEGLEIVLVSDSLPDYQTLVDAADPDATVIVYDADVESADDVIGRVTDLAAQEGKQIDSLTIMSHGGAGYFRLGTEVVKAENIEAYQAAWDSLNQVMISGGDINIFGCSVANDAEEGQALVDALADATDADVFVSDDITGGSGDWDLEVGSNEQETFHAPLSTDLLADYHDDFATPWIPSNGIGYSNIEDVAPSFGITVYVPETVTDPQNTYDLVVNLNGDNVLYQVSTNDEWSLNPNAPVQAGFTAYEVHVQYTPHDNVNGPASFKATIYQQGQHNPSGLIDSEIININVNAVNDAPILTPPPASGEIMTIGTVDEDQIIEKTVDQILATAGADPITDVDGNVTGIAIIGLKTTVISINGHNYNIGSWYYNDGSGEKLIPTVSETNAIVLDRNDTLIFKPNQDEINRLVRENPGNVNNNTIELDDAITFRAWDKTDGATSGNFVNTTLKPDQSSYPLDSWAYSSDMTYTSPQTNTTITGVESRDISLNIALINDAPDAPDLNPMTYVENNTPTHMDVTLGTDPDDSHLSRAEITFVSNYHQGEDVLNYTTINGITGSWNASTGTLTLTGNATIAQYQQAIRSVTYGDPADDDPTEGTRTLRVTITDTNSSGSPNGPQSSSSQTTLFVDAVNDAPDLEAETGDLDYDEDSGPQVIDNDFQLSDVDDENMTRATIQITSGYVAGEDVLAFTNTGSITGSWNASTGTLTLTGLASEAAYQAALRTVTYENTNTNNPNTTARQITFTIRDNNSRGFGDGPNGTGGYMTDSVIRTVNINALPDPPTRPDTEPMDMTEDSDNPNQINADGSYGKLPNDGDFISNIVNPFTDPDTGQTLQSIAITGVDDTNGTWQYSLNNGATWTPIQTADNTVSETNALLLDQNAKLRFVPNENFNTRTTSTQVDGVNTPTLTIKSWDQSSGSEGQYVNTVSDPAFSPGSSTIEMEVLAVNDQPVLDVGDGEVDIEDYRVAQAIDGITTDDIDLNEFLNQAAADTGKVEVTLTAGKGVISISQTNGLDFISGNGTSTVTLKGDLALVQTAISENSLSYLANQSDAEDFIQNGDITQAFDTLNIKVDDIGNYGLPHQRDVDGEVSLYLKNLAPVVNLDEDDSGSDYPSTPNNPDGEGISPNFEIIFVEKAENGSCPPVRIADHDALITDPDSEFLNSLTVIFTNKQEGDQLHYDDSIVQANNLNVVQTEENGQLVLRFEGQATPEAYTSLLRSITFDNSSDNPSDVKRVIRVEAADLDELNGGDGNVSEIVTSYISVVPVNDAPDVSAPTDVSTSVDTPIDINGIVSSDVDVGDGLVSAELTVQAGTIEIASGNDPDISGNGSRRIVIQNKTMDQLNALLRTVQYTPLNNFAGDDTLTVTVNDQGGTGVNGDTHVNSCNQLNEDNIQADTGQNYTLNPDGTVPDFNNEGTGSDPSAQIGQAVITIHITTSGPEVPTGPETPTGPPLLPITKPEGAGMSPIGPGLVRLPGPVGETEGISLGSRGIGGPDNWVFCSIEDALRAHLGCRFANTTDFEAKIGSVSWADLGWSRPFLDEEYDLFKQLFIREADDPGFNVPAETFDTDHGGLPDQAHPLFADATPGSSLKDMEGGEIKEAFFQGRKELDKTWSRYPLWNKLTGKSE